MQRAVKKIKVPSNFKHFSINDLSKDGKCAAVRTEQFNWRGAVVDAAVECDEKWRTSAKLEESTFNLFECVEENLSAVHI